VELTWLRAFVSVARTGSIEAAADALGQPPSAVGREVSALESSFGSQLLDRGAFGVRLTEGGRLLLDHAEDVLGRLVDAERELASLRVRTGGHLRLGAFAAANAVLVPRALAAFEAEHPDVSITNREGSVRQLVMGLRAGELDLAVISVAEGQSPEDVTLHRLMFDRMHVAVPATHRLAERRRVRLADLAGESWIAGIGRADDMPVSAIPGPEFAPRLDIVVGEWLTKLGFVGSGLGITLVPAIAVDAVPASVRLVPLHPDDTPLRTIFAATPAYTYVPDLAPAFVRTLRDVARTLAQPGGPPLTTGSGPPAHLRGARNDQEAPLQPMTDSEESQSPADDGASNPPSGTEAAQPDHPVRETPGPPSQPVIVG
jgi:DNA-binding transcriptional LysR family regulator